MKLSEAINKGLRYGPAAIGCPMSEEGGIDVFGAAFIATFPGGNLPAQHLDLVARLAEVYPELNRKVALSIAGKPQYDDMELSRALLFLNDVEKMPRETVVAYLQLSGY